MKHKVAEHPPLDMEEFLRSPPAGPSSCPAESTLWLLGQMLDDHCAEVLARTLRNGDWRHITHLSLAHNDITPVGMAAIFGALAEGAMPLLKQLNATNLDVGDDGATALAAALPALPALYQLELVESNIGEKGAVALMSAVKDLAQPMRQLYSLYFNKNPIGDDGVIAICEACESGKLPGLNVLYMSGCSIGDEGCLALSNAIEDGHMDHVRIIYLQQCRASKDGFEVVNNVIKEYEKKQPVVYF